MKLALEVEIGGAATSHQLRERAAIAIVHSDQLAKPNLHQMIGCRVTHENA